MKRIEFRGKEKVSQLWIYGSLVIHENRTFIIFKGAKMREKSLINGLIEVIPESVGQFIGRCDKNKKEIYAGDIVEWENNFGDKIIGWIRYTESIAGFYVVLIKGGYQPFYDFSGGKNKKNFAWSGLRVVGNKTENPEMMDYEYWVKGKKNRKEEEKNEFLQKFS